MAGLLLFFDAGRITLCIGFRAACGEVEANEQEYAGRYVFVEWYHMALIYRLNALQNE